MKHLIIDNSNLAKRNDSVSYSSGFLSEEKQREADLLNPTPAAALHHEECDCQGKGYFIGDCAAYSTGDIYFAPAGRLLLTYCGVSDAPTDEEILTAYGTQRDTAYEIDKWGTIVVYPREEHKHLCREED